MWNTKELAKRAGVTDDFVRQQLLAGEIYGEEMDEDWSIPDEEAERWLKERGVDLAAEEPRKEE